MRSQLSMRKYEIAKVSQYQIYAYTKTQNTRERETLSGKPSVCISENLVLTFITRKTRCSASQSLMRSSITRVTRGSTSQSSKLAAVAVCTICSSYTKMDQ